MTAAVLRGGRYLGANEAEDAEMPERPQSVSVVGWIMLILGAIGVFGSLLPLLPAIRNDAEFQKAMADSPLSIEATVAVGVISSLVFIVCAVGFLKGWGWARWLYGIQVVGNFILGLATSGTTVAQLPSLVLAAIVLTIVFRPAANEFFAATSDDPFEDATRRDLV